MKNEERFTWLEDIKDSAGRRRGDPGYDPKTLFIPQDAWKKFTPFEKQFWKIKSNHFDTVVFFQKGKFYELYENDAGSFFPLMLHEFSLFRLGKLTKNLFLDIGHQVFDLKMTERVNMRMVGVPVAKFDYWAAQFLAKGYRVAKCDEKETAMAKSLRERENGIKGERIIDRNLTRIFTNGTLTYSDILTDDLPSLCISIEESFSSDSTFLSLES